jgi:hypothetical protein
MWIFKITGLDLIWAVFVLGGLFPIIEHWYFFKQKPETTVATVIHFKQTNAKYGKGMPTFRYKAKDSIEYTFLHEHEERPQDFPIGKQTMLYYHSTDYKNVRLFSKLYRLGWLFVVMGLFCHVVTSYAFRAEAEIADLPEKKKKRTQKR